MMILRKVLTFINVILLVLSFLLCLYINVHMNVELGNNVFGKKIFDFFIPLIPFVLLMGLLFINFINDHSMINKNIGYKIVFIFSMIVIIFIEYRALFDKNMILLFKTNHYINFDYFVDQLLPIKLILYGLCLVNILFVIEEFFINRTVKRAN